MKVLTIDVGGTHVKLLASDEVEPRKFASDLALTPGEMVAEVKRISADWNYEVISIGYPGLVMHGRIASEPRNLRRGWVGFDFAGAFGKQICYLAIPHNA